MPFTTPNYRLAAFQRGEPYSAYLDQSRFITIDNHLRWLSEQCGNGVINGWDISNDSASNDLSVVVSDGSGLIDSEITRTFGDLKLSLSDNSVIYLFMQKKKSFLGGGGTFSNIFTFDFEDTVAPQTPNNFVVSETSYNFISFTWTSNLEKDLDYYIIYRDAVQIGTSKINSYTDNSVEESTFYSYAISAIDKSGNESPQTAAILISTIADDRPPLNPEYPYILSGDEYIQVAWSPPSFGIASSYSISIYDITYSDCGRNSNIGLSWNTLLLGQWAALTAEQYAALLAEPFGAIPVGMYSTTNTDIIINGLENGHYYLVILQSLSDISISSTGVAMTATPKATIGPAEVQNVSVFEYQSQSNIRGIRLDIQWDIGINPYKPLADKFVLTVIENGTLTSDPIVVYNGTFVSIEDFTCNGDKYPILSQTFYIVKIQSVDISNNYNNGIVDSIYTSKFYAPSSPYSIKSKLTNEKNILFVWSNSIDDFDYNYLTVMKKDLDTNIQTTILAKSNYGKNRSYSIEAPVSLNNKYTITLQSVDSFGNISNSVSSSYTTGKQTTLNLPVPRDQYAFSSDGAVTIIWRDPSQSTAAYYKIWRANFSTNIVYSGFSLIDTIPGDYQSYTDYSAENGSKYYYFVTKVDIYGKESKNLVDDSYHYYPMCYTYPHTNNIITKVYALNIDNSGIPNDFDAILQWNDSEDSFDGYEIYRSNLNKYSWNKIGYTDKKISSFTDFDALISGDGNYYYMVRKFKNEARLVASYSNIHPTASIPLAKVTTLFGTVLIEDMRDNISSLANVVETYLDDMIDSHKHSLRSDYDRRIDLSKNIIISNWTTTDNKLFVTTDDFSNASSYSVKVDESIPSVFYEVDEENKTILFAEPITSTNIKLECLGLSETSGQIPDLSINNSFKNLVDDVSATQSESSKFRRVQIPDINHIGRTDEILIPLQTRMVTEDGYTFKIYQNENSDISESIGSSWTFFDVDVVVTNTSLCWHIFSVNQWFDLTPDEWNLLVVDCPEYIYAISDSSVTRLLAATSNGILSSKDMGETWEKVINISDTVHKIYKAPVSRRIFAVTNKNVYISQNGVTWAKTDGLDNVGMIRDVIEDNAENAYISTDLGVYILKQLDFGDYLVWQQSTIIDDETSNVYALFLDSSSPYISNKIIASTEVGLFETVNYGQTWSYISDLRERVPIRQFAVYGTNIFAISDNSIWRKKPDSVYYDRIASFDGDNVHRFVIYNRRIIVSTDIGLFISSNNYDIDNSLEIELEDVLPVINFSPKITPIFALKVIDKLLFLGTDQMLFGGDSVDNVELLYSKTSGIIPSVYIDGEEMVIGYQYDINNNILSFSDRIDDSSIVTVANQYDVYRASYGGWTDQSYDSNFSVFNNGILASTFDGIEIDFVTASLNGVAFEDFTEANSNRETAIEYSNKFETDLLRLVSINEGTSSLSSGETLQDLTSEIVDDYNKTYYQVLGKIRFASLISYNNQQYTVFNNEKVLLSLTDSLLSNYELISTIPSMTSSTSIGTANIVDGVFIFASSFNKYNVVRMSVEKTSLKSQGTNTHTEIDDSLDSINSGLSMALSDVHQSNILKTELFFNRELEDFTSISDNTYYKSPILSSSIDTLNSTVGYHVENKNTNVSFVIKYPTAVEYIIDGSVVLVGDDNGLISIKTSDHSMSVVMFNEFNEDEFVKDIYYDSDDKITYLLSNYNLYISEDGALTWNREWTKGLNNKLRKVSKISDNIIIAADDGIYYKSPLNSVWIKSLNVSNSTILSPARVLYVVANNILYYSYDGIVWNNGGSFGNIQINAMVPYRCDIAMATNKGYRLGAGTFFGNIAQSSLVNLLSDVSQSESIKFNDLDTDDYNMLSLSSTIVLGADDGTYWTVNGNSYTQYNDSLLTCVHKVLYVGNEYWLFGFDNLKLPGVTSPIKLSIGTAL